MQYRFWSLPLPLIDFFEASPYGVFANGGNSSSTAAAVPLLPQEKATKSHAHDNKFLKGATRLCGYAQT